MGPSNLRRRITLQSRTLTTNSIGEEISTYTVLADVWAEVIPLRGREYYEAQQERNDDVRKFRIRFREDVTRDAQVVYQTLNYDIMHIEEVGFRHYLDLTCRSNPQ